MSESSAPVALATKLRRITLTALRRSMGLTGHCEMCGAGTLSVAFWAEGGYTELCAGCAGAANRRVGDDLDRGGL